MANRADRRHAEKSQKATHAQRRAICVEYGVRNTGRQWVRLRKRLQRAYRTATGRR